MNETDVKQKLVVRGDGYGLAHLFFVVPFIILNVQYVLSVLRRRRLQKQFRAVLQSGGVTSGSSGRSESKSDKKG